MKIIKFENGYKIKKEQSLIDKLNPFSKAEYLQGLKSKRKEQMHDLFFKTKENAIKFLDIKDRIATDDDIVFGSKEQLKTIFSHFNIDPSKYEWADVWTGRQNWAIALSQILNQNVLAVDLDERSYGDPIEYLSKKVSFLKMNTEIDSLPANINAVFLRSTIGASSINKILLNNPNIQLIIVVPEGLNSNEGFPFKGELRVVKKFFLDCYQQDLNSEFCIKGSHSTAIRFCHDFPVLIGKNKKRLGFKT